MARLATLEATYADRDTEFDKRLTDLEALRLGSTRDARVDFAAGCSGVHSHFDEVHNSQSKLDKACAREVFDSVPQRAGFPSPSFKAAAQHAAGLTAELPVLGRRVESTTRDSGSGVISTWIPIPANGTWSLPKSPVQFQQV